MAMRPKLWSISAIATELNLDRRTVAARLRGTAPKGKIKGGHDGWLLADALAACADPRLPPWRPQEGRPEWANALEQYESSGAAGDAVGSLAMGLTAACCAAPRLFAIAAVNAGASVPAAFAGSNLFLALLLAKADDLLRSIAPGTEFAIDRRLIEEVDWSELAAAAGATFDPAACDAHQAEMAAKINAAG